MLETNEVIAVNKSKIVLLTILIVLVLYCGAVIFITKPGSNAYQGLFGSAGNASAQAAPASQGTSVDTDAILAQAEKIATDKAEAARKSSADYADSAIADAISKLVIPEAVETVVQGDTIIQKEEFDLEAHLPEIVDAVSAELLKEKDAIIDMVVDALIEKLDASEATGEVDYDTARRQKREEEIKKMLEQLQD